jgi:anti-sigma factor RsiW
MNGHEEIRDLLTLAAAGALDAAGQRRVEDHLRECRDCRTELESWQQLTGALKEMPTPQAPMGLVERTRRRMERQAAARVEQRRRRLLLVWLTAFAWASTLLTLPALRLVGGRLGQWLGLEWTGFSVTEAFIAYVVVSWMISVVVAGLLGQRHQQQGGHNEPVFG